MKTRPIEMYRLNEDSTWHTVHVDIPANTHLALIEEVAQIEAAKRWGMAKYVVYNSMDDDCPEDEVPDRTEVEVVLSFDMNETTVGSEIEQQDAAIDQINLTLQRDPHQLGARIERKSS